MGQFGKTLKGMGWMGSLQVSIRIVTFIRLGILARILSPFEFGLFGIATLILALLETISDTGINVFFIQKEGKLEDYIDTAWFVSIIRGTAIALLILIFAPFVAYFFHSSESSNLIRLIALVPFIRGFLNPSIVRLQKELKFNREFLLRIFTATVDVIVSITVAFITKSSIAMIWGMIAGVSIELIISHLFISPRPKISLDTIKFKKVVNRGKWITFSNIFQYIFSNGDNIIVGRILGTDFLGLYQMAYRISTIPITEISDVASRVNFAVYSEISQDKRKLIDTFLKSFVLVFLLVVPLGIVLFFFTYPIVNLILGKNWLEIVPVLKVLTVFGVLRSLEGTVPPLFLAVKKQEYVTYLTLASMLGLVLTIYPLVSIFGIIGAAYSAMFGSLVMLPLLVYFLRKTFC